MNSEIAAIDFLVAFTQQHVGYDLSELGLKWLLRARWHLERVVEAEIRGLRLEAEA